ncbi:ABC transporter ATP-binding protein [Pseudonocardia abyssalis]|uniref:ABC transporter ATP-binding protein n=1 Tax=Pseudonocardia abyssalis TaxID=2792008 RepID=A0ABS6UKS0_9PSEU|nr:ABC transporter ATP-binding protein [Pseudonocardia abyssalis]MBW0117110.1 ABC transporter ATP-binding protein [Pseudonocardia abyssalis]MBW0132860.1 ABC transporter ATP-binding protein [Pseudonocardia abyssalis]
MSVRLTGVRRTHGPVVALDVDDLEIPAGSLTVVVGPSGCGKSTLLSLVAGLAAPDTGRIHLGGADVTDRPPGERDVAMVFQDFALFPHMTVEQNVSFGLRLARRHGHGPDRAEIARRVGQACERLGLAGLESRRPGELSGGERQRVALARAIVRRRAVLLLDEPLSSLDAQLRTRARAELVRLHRELGATVVLVTHDQAEALSVATHLVVMRGGRVVQAGPPREVYGRPAELFVGEFLGGLNLHDRDGLRLAWRPAEGRLVATGSVCVDGDEGFDGTVDVVEFTGDGRIVHCTGPDGRWAVAGPGPDPVVGERVRVHVPAAALHRFDATTGARSRPRHRDVGSPS